ncbi:hypothetical protein EI94DRAFT_1744963 [Lactarius quietus]|nr:hypothetical protein EI94DRAFT_1744963 [Lactarius quietus]
MLIVFRGHGYSTLALGSSYASHPNADIIHTNIEPPLQPETVAAITNSSARLNLTTKCVLLLCSLLRSTEEYHTWHVGDPCITLSLESWNPTQGGSGRLARPSHMDIFIVLRLSPIISLRVYYFHLLAASSLATPLVLGHVKTPTCCSANCPT